jgi:transcriptional regulator with XRE-family HTH domain
MRRAELGMKRKDLARESGLSYPYVSEIENGLKEPSARALRMLAQALDLTTGSLLELVGRLEEPGPGSILVEQTSTRSVPNHELASDSGRPPLEVLEAMRGLFDQWLAEEALDLSEVSPSNANASFANAVEIRLRAQLDRWARTELPRLIRTELQRALEDKPGT